jgi:hypothetical protein
MTYVRPEQKLVSFTDSKADLERISNDMSNGWTIISLVRNGNYYVGIMENTMDSNVRSIETQSVFIPPRKKIKISM